MLLHPCLTCDIVMRRLCRYYNFCCIFLLSEMNCKTNGHGQELLEPWPMAVAKHGVTVCLGALHFITYDGVDD